MTELERHLLNALEQLQQDYMQRLNEWESRSEEHTFAERIRATATGLYAAAERMGERLRGIAENVFAYATGQRDAERAGHRSEEHT
ncbi:DNA relaxase mbeA [Escherichia coli KTE69]|nr:DNA relaxase mbeA [Escherichia coli KTE69]